MSQFAGVFFILAIIGFSIAGSAAIYKIVEGRKECKFNNDCQLNNYCGSDFKCHPFPTIENKVTNNNWVTPAAILGFSIVIAAMILRKKSSPPKQFY